MQCEFCSSDTATRSVKKQHWFKGRLYIVENVKAEVCPECGERYFHATTLADGKAKTLADYKGQVVLLNVWATWCAPCRVEIPSIEHLYQQLGPEGLKVVAVSIDEAGPEVVREFAREHAMSFDILLNPTRTIERIYQTTGVPESFVLNRDGRIVKKVIGATEWDAPVNRDLIRRLLVQKD